MTTFIESTWLSVALWIAATGILILQILQNLIYFSQLVLAFPQFISARSRASRLREWWLLTSEATPPITLLVPAYNEEATIVESLRSLFTLHYPDYEIVVVNDGSKDGTLQRLIEAFELERVPRVVPNRIAYQNVRGVYACHAISNLLVVDKENGGKSDALNAAMDLATHPYVCAVDADSLLDSDALLRAIRPFVDAPETTLAVGGTIRVANGCVVRAGQVLEVRPPTKWVELFQAVEYLRAFLVARMAWTQNKEVTIISGAFGVFRKDVVLELGGYTHGTVGEDMELVVRLHRWSRDGEHGGQIIHVPDAICWTEAPSTLQVLGRQRTRWQRGMCETLWRHRCMIGRAKYGPVGILALPAFVLFDVISPFLELLGLILVPICAILGILSWQFFVAYCAVVFGFGLCLSLCAVMLSQLSSLQHRRVRDLLWLGLGAIIENFGYRQLNSWWRVHGIIQFLRKKQGWGAMPRRGFSSV